MFLSDSTIFPSGSVTLVSSNVWKKNFRGSFDICMRLQNSELIAKVGSVPAAYPADSTKPFAKFATMQL